MRGFKGRFSNLHSTQPSPAMAGGDWPSASMLAIVRGPSAGSEMPIAKAGESIFSGTW